MLNLEETHSESKATKQSNQNKTSRPLANHRKSDFNEFLGKPPGKNETKSLNKYELGFEFQSFSGQNIEEKASFD